MICEICGKDGKIRNVYNQHAMGYMNVCEDCYNKFRGGVDTYE